MSRSINKAIILGNLTRDPVLRYTQSGRPVCDFGIATNRSWTTDKGEKKELAEFHNIVAWGKLAEIASEYLTKGRKVYAEGRLQTRNYETPDGQTKYRTEIVLDDLVMLDGKENATRTAAERGKTASAASGDTHDEPADTSFPQGEIPGNPDEIPF